MARNRESRVTISLRDRVTTRLKQIERGFGSLVGRLTRLGTVAAGLVTGAGAVLGGRFLAGAVRSAAEFQEQMARVGAVAGATGDEIAALTEAASVAGANTRFTATEAAQGLEELTRAGQSAREAIETLNPALQVAQANQIAVADAATLTTTTLNQFGLEARSAGRVADVLTRGTQTSAQNIEQLGNALEFAGPQARQMGLSLEQTTGIIGKLADQGFRGEKGGTALRNALIELQNPSSNFARELQALGIESTNFVEVLDQLSAKGDQSRDAILALGKRAGPAINALVQGGVDDLGVLIGELEKAAGTAERTAAAMDDNLPGALLGLSSAYDAARRALAEPLLEPIQAAVQQVTTKLREFASSGLLTEVGQQLAGIFNQGVEAARNFLSEFTFEEAVNAAKTFLSDTADVFRTFVENAQAAASGARDAWNGFGLIFDGIKVATFGAAAGVVQIAKAALQAEIATKKAAIAWRDFVGLDVTGLQEQLRELEISLGGLQEAQDEFFRRGESSAESAAENWRQLTESADEAAGSIRSTVDELSGVTEETAEAAAETQRLGDVFWEAYNRGKEAAEGAAQGVSAVNAAVDESEGKVKTLNDRIAELGGGIREQLEADAAAAAAAFEATLDSQSATLEQKQAAFLAYAEAAINANAGVVTSELENQAALLGTSEALDELAQKIAQVKGAQVDATAGIRAGVQGIGAASQQTAQQINQTADTVVNRARGLGEFIGGIITSWTRLNEDASGAIERAFKRINRGVQTTQGYLAKLARLTRTFSRLQDEQVSKLARVQEAYRNTGDAAAFLRGATDLANRRLQLLDQATLDQLRMQIVQVRAEMESFRASTVNALRSAQRELLSLQGRELEVLRLDAEAKIAELEALLEQAPDRESRRNLREAIRLQERILGIKEDQIRANQQAAAEEARRAAEEVQVADTPTVQSSPAPAASAPAPVSGFSSGRVITIRLEGGGMSADVFAEDEAIAERVIEILRGLGVVTGG